MKTMIRREWTFLNRPKAFWITSAGAAGVLILSLFNWVDIGFGVKFNLFNVWGKLDDSGLNFLLGWSQRFQNVKTFLSALLIILIVSFVLLIISLIKYQSKKRLILVNLGFGLVAAVPPVFITSVLVTFQGEGIEGLTIFPFLVFAVAFIAIVLNGYTFEILNGLFFALFTLICIFPFYYLFINTISDNNLVAVGRINIFPQGVHLGNYAALLGVNEIGRAAFISIARTIIGTVTMVLASAFVGYLVTKNAMLGRKFIYRFIIITMYFNAGLIPWFVNIQMLGLTNNFWGYIIPAIVQPFNIILVKTYIESIPKELEESAFMDGAGYFTTFRKIIFPLCKPILATISVFGAVGHWNSFMDSIILMGGEPRLYTLQHRLYLYLRTNASDIETRMREGSLNMESVIDNRVISLTVAMATIVPIILVYPFMQRYFQKGLMLGAVKG